jgi:hypothetical protein
VLNKIDPQKLKIMNQKTNIATCLCLNLICLLGITRVTAQNTQLNYNIKFNGTEMGSMILQRSVSTGSTKLALESKAKKRFIVLFEIYETHSEIFQNDVMTTASVFRQVNGKTKINMQMSCEGANCKIASEGKTNTIALKPVSWSVLNLYFAEPEKISEVFSDSFQQMLKIENIGNHEYKISLPDGNSNYFYYTNGVCTKEVINHSLYKVEIVLTGNR